MSDLKSMLKSRHMQGYRLFRDASAVRLAPIQMFSKHDIVHEMAVQCMLRRERYQLTWRVAAENSNLVTRFELLVFLSNYQQPDMRFDLRDTPSHSIAFDVPASKHMYVLLRISSRCVVTVHTLYLNVARSCLLGRDPLMFEWDLQIVGRALRQQRQMIKTINRMAALWDWKNVRTMFGDLLLLWRKAFPTLADTSLEACEQGQLVKCQWSYPTVIATSSRSLLAEFVYEDSAWLLVVGANRVEPTFVHIQYLIWCFPDRGIKIALQRDVIPSGNDVRLKLAIEGHAQRSPPHFYMGFNMAMNVPFHNLWSVCSTIEFVNANDLLVLFKQIELHFADEAMFEEDTLL